MFLRISWTPKCGGILTWRAVFKHIIIDYIWCRDSQVIASEMVFTFTGGLFCRRSFGFLSACNLRWIDLLIILSILKRGCKCNARRRRCLLLGFLFPFFFHFTSPFFSFQFIILFSISSFNIFYFKFIFINYFNLFSINLSQFKINMDVWLVLGICLIFIIV
jgi:hypothetical protein